MSKFIEFRRDMQTHLKEMLSSEAVTLRVQLDSNTLYEKYLDSFAPEDNPIYRERREHDCNCCKNFIKKISPLVVVKNGKFITVWDFKTNSVYQPSVDALASYIHSSLKEDTIFGLYRDERGRIGTESTPEFLEDTGLIKTWEHLFVDLPERLVSNVPDTVYACSRENSTLLKRALDELTLDAVQTALDFSKEGSFYKIGEFQQQLQSFLDLKKKYANCGDNWIEKLSFCYDALERDSTNPRIRNTALGTFLINLSEGLEEEKAIRAFLNVVAPENYKMPKEIYSKKMVEEARLYFSKNGYGDLRRRYASLDDISVNDVLYLNRDATKKASSDIFDMMSEDIPENSKNYLAKAQEVTIEEFLGDVVPTAKKLEVLFDSSFKKNLVSLIAPVDKTSKAITSWNNNFTWSYKGGLADSAMKENLRKVGAKVEGVFRASLQWNDKGDNLFDLCDLDIHMKSLTDRSYEIYYGKRRGIFGGELDHDIRNPKKGVPAVENIIFEERIPDGRFKIFVNPFAGICKHGFSVEIEVDGEIMSFSLPNTRKRVDIAEVAVKNGVITVTPVVECSRAKTEIWGLKTQEFVPISAIMTSPNHWDGEKGDGTRHYFFMTPNCINDESPRGFTNVHVNSELQSGVNKRFLSALGSRTRVEDSKEQLSGLGFTSVGRDFFVIVKADEKVYKINFK